MSQKNEKEEIKEQILKFTSFTNPNNFDDYFAKVLPSLSKIKQKLLILISFKILLILLIIYLKKSKI